ncbi:MAG: aminodeoxychorismate synthase component I [Legionellales bacterium]|jgi:para-aminobenzoate synthetase component 1
MSTSYLTELPYYENSCIYFEQISNEAWPVFLDSCKPASTLGRYDILSAQPYSHLTTYGKTTTITSPKGTIQSDADPFSLVKQQLALHSAFNSHLPFNGGALGYFAYDLKQRLEELPDTVIHDITLPDMSVGIYLWAVIVDHLEKKTYLLMPPKDRCPENWHEIKNRLTSASPEGERFFAPTDSGDSLYVDNPPSVGAKNLSPSGDNRRSNLTQDQYSEKFTQIMQHINQGDTYQINFAQRWQSTFDENPWDLYQHLREKNPAPFSAYIPMPQGAILSCSPERFLTVNNREVITMPIKGTAKRESDPILDQQAAQTLLNSEKNRAENIMIVDLMRNDLGKSCITGSVHVAKLCELQSFTNVHHLVSTVCGQLRADKQPIDLLRDCFPGGSITGAPKIRAMELIDQFEPHQRHIYCGSIGYINFNGQMDTNIAIRTIVINDNHLYFWGGGGIVKDSQADLEYQETLDKVRPFLNM